MAEDEPGGGRGPRGPCPRPRGGLRRRVRVRLRPRGMDRGPARRRRGGPRAPGGGVPPRGGQDHRRARGQGARHRQALPWRRGRRLRARPRRRGRIRPHSGHGGRWRRLRRRQDQGLRREEVHRQGRPGPEAGPRRQAGQRHRREGGGLRRGPHRRGRPRLRKDVQRMQDRPRRRRELSVHRHRILPEGRRGPGQELRRQPNREEDPLGHRRRRGDEGQVLQDLPRHHRPPQGGQGIEGRRDGGCPAHGRDRRQPHPADHPLRRGGRRGQPRRHHRQAQRGHRLLHGVPRDPRGEGVRAHGAGPHRARRVPHPGRGGEGRGQEVRRPRRREG